MSTFRPTITTSPVPASSPYRRFALAAGAGIIVACVGLLNVDPPSDPAVGRPAVGRPASEDRASPDATWSAAVRANLAVRGRPSAGPGSDLAGKAALMPLKLTPIMADGQGAGFNISSIAETGPLAESGLRAGDVLLTIDGLPLDADRARRLAEEFGSLDDVEVTYRRGGELRETLIVLRPR